MLRDPALRQKIRTQFGTDQAQMTDRCKGLLRQESSEPCIGCHVHICMRVLCLAILVLALAGPVLAQDAEAKTIIAGLRSTVASEAAWGAYRAGEKGIRPAIPHLVRLLRSWAGRRNEESLHLRLTVLDALIRLEATAPGDLDADLLQHQGNDLFRSRTIILLSRKPKENGAPLLELFRPKARGAFELELVAVGNLLAGVRSAGFVARLLSLLEFELEIVAHSTGDPQRLSVKKGLPRSGREWPVPPDGFPPLNRYEFTVNETADGTLLAAGPRPIWVIRHEVKSRGGWEEVYKEPTWRSACTFEWLGQLLGEDPEQVRIPTGGSPSVVFESPDDFKKRVREIHRKLLLPWYELLDRSLKAKLLTPRDARGIEPKVGLTIHDRRADQSISLPATGNSRWIYEHEFGPGGPYGGRKGHRNLRARGGGTKTEAAVNAGLDWLVGHQHWTGCWDADGFSKRFARESCPGPGKADLDLVNTSLALLAFLGAGHTDRFGNHQRTVRLGIDWLVAHQDEEGRFSSGAKRLGLYEHTLATLAVGEAGAITWDPVLTASARRGVEVLRAARLPSGVWGNAEGQTDPALTIWAYRALGNARACGLTIDQAEFDLLRPHLAEWEQSAPKLDGPLIPRSRAALLPLIILCKERNKHEWGYRSWKDPLVPVAAEGLRHPADLGEWFCGGAGLHMAGGDHWRDFNLKMKQTLLPLQVREGCERGSWSPEDLNEQDLGRVGVTACLVMCFEVYYRYAICF